MKSSIMYIGLVAFAMSGCAHQARVTASNCSGKTVQVGNTVVSLDDKVTAPSYISIGVLEPSANRIVFKDKDGDTFTNEFSPAAGTWKTVSGTGKYANAVASGRTHLERTEAGQAEGPVYVATWEGKCSIR